MSKPVTIVNMDGIEVLGRVSVKKAIIMIYDGKAKIVEAHVGKFIGPYPVPKIISLTKYIVALWKYKKKPDYSKRGVLRRDNFTCQYCGLPGNTLDHILPLSQGGKSTWLNTAAACFSCNQKKRNRTPEQANMRLIRQPFVPFLGDLAIV